MNSWRLLVLLWLVSPAVHAYEPQEGDVVFQTSLSRQSLAIQKATHSPYSHVGIVLFRSGKPFVLEAVQPVKFTPLADWLARGKNGHFVAKRSRTPLTPEALATFHRQGQKELGKPYDLTFEWSDQRMYCSELVWKLYHAAGIDLAPLARLQDFDLSAPEVRQIMHQRYGNRVPLQEPVIAPSALFDSPLLATVAEEDHPRAGSKMASRLRSSQ